MIQAKRKSPKKHTLENKVDNLIQTNSKILMANAQQEITIKSLQKTNANLLLEVARLKNQQITQ